MNRLEPFSAKTATPCRVITDPTEIEDLHAELLGDESRLRATKVRAVALPKDAAQLAQFLADCAKQNMPVSISGGRTGLVGGAVPLEEGAIISTQGLNEIGQVKRTPGGRATVRVGAGALLADLNEHLRQHHRDLFFPVDPTETAASIGGILATNASGMRSFRFGPARDWVRAIRVALPDGRLLDLERGRATVEAGSLVLDTPDGPRTLRASPIPKPATKNTLGYSWFEGMDAVDLFVGAEGTLGAITEADLLLSTKPDLRLFYLQFFEDEQAAFDLIEWLRSESALDVVAIELFDRRSLTLVSESSAATRCRYASAIRPSMQAAVYTELILRDEAAVQSAYEALESFLEARGVSTESSGAGTEEGDLLEMKVFRHAVPEQINKLIALRQRELPDIHKIATDMAVTDDDLRAIYASYKRALDEHGLDYAIFGHAGQNHFHVNILPRDMKEFTLAKQSLYPALAREVVSRKGAVSAEHGIGRTKRAFLNIQYSPEHIETMRDIKRFFDPLLLLNRGVLLED